MRILQMDLQTVMSELRAKPLMKKAGKNYDLSMTLYATGNYDAAYFAGMIAEQICTVLVDMGKTPIAYKGWNGFKRKNVRC